VAEDRTSWQVASSQIEEEVRAWRRAHPRASLTEIEQAFDTRLAQARANLLAEIAADAPEGTRRCRQCGGPLVGRGKRTRILRTTGDAEMALTRDYLSCPACSAGVFPPG
jgi:hypothetical protein